MTIPHLLHDEFMEYLKTKGCKVISDDFFNDYNRIIIITPTGDEETMQYCKTHYYLKVVRTCINLGIDPPKEHLECYKQIPPSQRKS